MIEILDIPTMLVRIINDLVSAEVAPEWLGKWVSLQAQATSLLTYQSSVIPGLLQIESYARAILKLTQRASPNLEDQVHARIARQEILTRDDPPPPLYHAILDEAVLRRPVGDPKTMSEQLMHVVEMAEQAESVLVQVIPFSKGEHAGNAGAFTLASFNGKEVAYVDNVLRADIVEKHEDVAAVRKVWQMLSTRALDEEESINMIKEAANQWIA